MKKIILLLFLGLALTVTGCRNEIHKVGEGELLQEDKSEKRGDEWSYKYRIEIDGQPITDKDIEVNNRDFKIVFAEDINEELSSTNSLEDKESLSGHRQDHLKILDIEPTNVTWTDGTMVTALVYEFENVPKNSNFRIELTDELKEVLGLNHSIINVHVK